MFSRNDRIWSECVRKRRKTGICGCEIEWVAVNRCDIISAYDNVHTIKAGYYYCAGGEINGKFTIKPKVTGSKVFEKFEIRETREKNRLSSRRMWERNH